MLYIYIYICIYQVVRDPNTDIVHCEYMALANKTFVFCETLCYCYVEPFEVCISKCCKQG